MVIDGNCKINDTFNCSININDIFRPTLAELNKWLHTKYLKGWEERRSLQPHEIPRLSRWLTAFRTVFTASLPFPRQNFHKPLQATSEFETTSPSFNSESWHLTFALFVEIFPTYRPMRPWNATHAEKLIQVCVARFRSLPFRSLLMLLSIDTTRFQTATSTTNNFPSLLRTKLYSKTQAITPKDMENTRRIQQECPPCKAKEMTWSEAQLRSADEGSTIFYRCSSCGYRYV